MVEYGTLVCGTASLMAMFMYCSNAAPVRLFDDNRVALMSIFESCKVDGECQLTVN